MSPTIQGQFRSTVYRSGTVYPYEIHIPDAPEGTEFALLVTQDGLNRAEAAVLDRLAPEGDAPQCIVLGVTPGDMQPSRPDGQPRNMRYNDYDFFTPDYANFLIEELIPHICRKHGLHITGNPDMHMISGGSSGGLAAWSAVWFRNDYFRRVYMSSPTFSSLGFGNEAPILIRRTEGKAIRAYIDYSEHEPDDYFGSSLCAAMEGVSALQFAGYDFASAYYPGEGHCSRLHDEATAETVMRFLWHDWQSKPVAAPERNPRIAAIVDGEWQRVQEPFPAKPACLSVTGAYTLLNGSIILHREDGSCTSYSAPVTPDCIAISSDLWRLYAADRRHACITAASIAADGTLQDWKRLCPLHMPVGFDAPGAYDLCTDAADRLFAATELGVQCIRSYGLVDAILPLPCNAIPLRLAFGGEGSRYLYADCGNAVYRRCMKHPAKTDPLSRTEPKFSSYYD